MKRLVLVCLLAACGGSDTGAADAAVYDAPPPMGRFAFSWTLTDGEAEVSCAELGATSVSLAIASQTTGIGFPENFSCTAGMGTSRAAEVGTYRIDVELLDSTGRTIATQPQQSGHELTEGTTTLSPFVFEASPEGSLSFAIDASGAAAEACSDEPGGAGVGELRLELRRSGACVPTTFSDGTTTLEADCTATRVACFEADRQLSTELTAGAYQLVVEGYEGDALCYTGARAFTVSGGGLVTELGSIGLGLEARNMDCTAP
jgi:hypothetical protein